MRGSPNISVAVVDDDESLCRSLDRLLRVVGLHPITYPSAEAFLADTNRPRFNCLVLDIQLGGMSGIEFQQQLATQGAVTPVIFITAYDSPEVRAQAQAAGCAAYFRKTDSGGAVVEAIRRITSDTATGGPPLNERLGF